jgi:hypothetical protein
MRKIKQDDFVGKTITAVDNSAVNVLKFKFSDGTELQLWSEIVILLNYGSGIPGFLTDGEPDPEDQSEVD